MPPRRTQKRVAQPQPPPKRDSVARTQPPPERSPGPLKQPSPERFPFALSISVGLLALFLVVLSASIRIRSPPSVNSEQIPQDSTAQISYKQPTARLTPQMTRICDAHHKLSLRNPTGMPETVYNILGLNPKASPFHPPELAANRGISGYSATDNIILEAWGRMAEPLLARLEKYNGQAGEHRQRGSYKERRKIPGAALTPREWDEEMLDIVASAASILLDNGLRTLYDDVFLPILTETSPLWSAGTMARRKRQELVRICHWE